MSVYAGDVGTIIKLDCQTDISGADDHFIRYEKPDGTAGEWDGVVSGTDYVQFTTIADSLPAAEWGPWRLQVRVENLGGWSGLSTVAILQVLEPIPAP